MAEVIQRHKESMTDEITEMTRLKLYKANETNIIMKKREYYECKINGPIKNIEDFTDYIKFEKDLLRDLKMRRNKFRIADRRGSIEIRIMKRIKNLYENSMQRFSNDVKLSMAYFKFCKEFNFHLAASLVVETMIKNFGYIPEAWQVAASWHMKKDTKQALILIHKGLIIHPSCEALYIEAIQLELLTRDKNDFLDDSNSQNKDNLCSKKIETLVDAIFKNIGNYNCFLNVLKILDNYSFTQNIKDYIIQKLMEEYVNEEKLWQALAERERSGLHSPVPDINATSAKFRLTRSLEKFEEGLLKICPEKKSELWILYLDYLSNVYDQESVSNNLIKATLLKALSEAKKTCMLAEKYYIIWATLLTDEEEVLNIIADGLRQFPTCVELWKLKLRSLIIKDNAKDINKEFENACLALRENSGPLWAMIIRYHIITSPNNIIEMVFKRAVTQPAEFAKEIKLQYLEWVVLCKDLESAREVYKTLSVTPPYCKELHTIMAKLELNDTDLNVKELERPLKLACQQFGSVDADVWISLRNCYYEQCQIFEEVYPSFDINIKDAQIRKEAEDALKDNIIMLTEFRNKYDMPTDI